VRFTKSCYCKFTAESAGEKNFENGSRVGEVVGKSNVLFVFYLRVRLQTDTDSVHCINVSS